jgi:hypothetical protein
MADSPLGPLINLAGAHLNAPPPVQAANRLVIGTQLLTACIYALMWSREFFGGTPEQIIHNNPIIALVWAAVAVLSAIWIVAGFLGPPMPRSGMSAFWAVVRGVLAICALKFQWWFPPDWGYWVAVADVVIRGVYIAILTGSVADLYGALRGGMGGNAAEKMRANLDQNRTPFRPARRK